MKIFVSWSGQLSKMIAKELKKWIPCIIQSASVFYSPEDIEKGQNWNSRITEELSNCNYGIICLTEENKNSPWINFEAGAIAKALDSRITALMIGINPSDIQGPLSSYQATKINKEEIFKLFVSINNCQENPIENGTLTFLFGAVWDKIEKNINKIIKEYEVPKKGVLKKSDNTEILEDILQIVREQNRIISNPSQILPADYLEVILGKTSSGSQNEVALMKYIKGIVGIICKLVNEDLEIEKTSTKNEIIARRMERLVDVINAMKKHYKIQDIELELELILLGNRLSEIREKRTEDSGRIKKITGTK